MEYSPPAHPFTATIQSRPVPASPAFPNPLIVNLLPSFSPTTNPGTTARFHLSPPARTVRNQG